MEESSKLSGLNAIQIPGVDTGRFEESFLEKTIQKRQSETGIDSLDAYLDFARKTEGEQKALERLLLNGYTEFFRNPLTFAVLEKIVLPSLIAERRALGKEVRIWSAACASGQEPYSLAMLLEENENSRNDSFRYRIIATDKSKSQIEHAKNGCYTLFSLGQVSMKRLSRWFDAELSGSGNNLYSIRSELKKNIDFSVFDLLDGHANVPPSSIFGNFDLVFCANLLFYYKPAYREIILNKITSSMTTNGLLIAGETERELLKQRGFTEIFHKAGIFRY